MQTVVCRDPRQMRQLAADFARRLRGTGTLALAGPLGSGKTEFVKGLAWGLGIRRPVTSPTFVLHKRYAFTYRRRRHWLEHFDLYRLRSAADAAALDIAALAAGPRRLVAIEWPGAARTLLPSRVHRFRFAYGKTPQQRIVTYAGPRRLPSPRPAAAAD